MAYQPEFAEPIANLSVAVGRDATFQCMVLHLGGYRVCYFSLYTYGAQALLTSSADQEIICLLRDMKVNQNIGRSCLTL